MNSPKISELLKEMRNFAAFWKRVSIVVWSLKKVDQIAFFAKYRFDTVEIKLSKHEKLMF